MLTTDVAIVRLEHHRRPAAGALSFSLAGVSTLYEAESTHHRLWVLVVGLAQASESPVVRTE